MTGFFYHGRWIELDYIYGIPERFRDYICCPSRSSYLMQTIKQDNWNPYEDQIPKLGSYMGLNYYFCKLKGPDFPIIHVSPKVNGIEYQIIRRPDWCPLLQEKDNDQRNTSRYLL